MEKKHCRNGDEFASKVLRNSVAHILSSMGLELCEGPAFEALVDASMLKILELGKTISKLDIPIVSSPATTIPTSNVALPSSTTMTSSEANSSHGNSSSSSSSSSSLTPNASFSLALRAIDKVNKSNGEWLKLKDVANEKLYSKISCTNFPVPHTDKISVTNPVSVTSSTLSLPSFLPPFPAQHTFKKTKMEPLKPKQSELDQEERNKMERRKLILQKLADLEKNKKE